MLPSQVTEPLGYGPRPNIAQLSYDLLDPTPTTGRRQALVRAIEDHMAAGGQEASGDFEADTRPQIVGVDDAFGNVWGRYRYFTNTTRPGAKQSSADVAPALNKLNGLLQGASGLFETGRVMAKDGVQQWVPRFSITPAGILARRDVFFVLSFGREDRLTEDVRKTASSMILWVLWDAIKRECNDWQRMGRSIAVYCDELWTIAGSHSAEAHPVIAEMFDGGRSFGLQLAFATQRLGQLPPGRPGCDAQLCHEGLLPPDRPRARSHRGSRARHESRSRDDGSGHPRAPSPKRRGHRPGGSERAHLGHLWPQGAQRRRDLRHR
ncbi:MAG: hypothetical protein ACYDGN_12305 [Acidimicrobiales bacterium]